MPAAQRWKHLSRDGFAAAKDLSQWKRALGNQWGEVRIEEVQANDTAELPVGSQVHVRAKVRLGEVKPEDVAVELFHGRVDARGELVEGHAETLECKQKLDNGSYWFHGQIPCRRSGRHGYAVRVLPRHDDLPHRYDTGLILWG